MFGFFQDFSPTERRNILIYIMGLTIYKFVLETLGACMSGIVLNRLGYDPVTKKPGSNTGVIWTTMQSINLACQCLGSLLIGPLVKRFRIGTIFATTVVCFAVVLSVIPILEGATGGKIPKVTSKGSSIASNWGTWDPYLLYLLFPLSGLFAGMVDLMRRVIPNDIVGGDAIKLKTMDASVHLCWEIAGTAGAILSVNWISYFGWGYAPLIISVGFLIASTFFFFILPREERLLKEAEERRMAAESGKPKTVVGEIASFAWAFVHNMWIGAKLVCTQRALFWLLPAYTLPLILHRYLEGTVFPFYARGVLLNSDLQQILNGGSNFGEAMGAVLVLVLAKRVKTPIPYLRLDALLILLIWVLPFWNPESPSKTLQHAWSLAPIMAIISFGWSCGDVALAAYVQSRLQDVETVDKSTSPLGAVMAFLYVSNLVVYFILNNLMGRVRDDFARNGRSLQELFIWIAAVAMTVGGVIVFACTYLPRGSAAWNPDPDVIVFDDDIVINGVKARRITDEDKKVDLVEEAVAVADAGEKNSEGFIVTKG
ncbi:hypothetical protein HDU67_009552 [Dinochytrium kinnereticum]|nr:hypothetical protein HDU67_009552 [Dinochytrium kinnereticum]